MERLDPRQLNHVAAALAVWAFAVGELPALLPRNEPAPPAAPPASAGSGVNMGAVGGGAVGGLALAAGVAFAVKAWRARVAAGGGGAAQYRAVPAQGGVFTA